MSKMLLYSALLLLHRPSLCGSGNMVSFNTYEYLTKRRGVRENGLVVNETVWPCDWILLACSGPERGLLRCK